LRTDSTGLSELIADWKTMAMRRQRNARRSSPARPMMSMGIEVSGLKVTVPPTSRAGARNSRVTAYARVDFPQPLSPAMPSTSPRARSKLTSRTAWVGWFRP
jgi:hypothetical protein